MRFCFDPDQFDNLPMIKYGEESWKGLVGNQRNRNLSQGLDIVNK